MHGNISGELGGTAFQFYKDSNLSKMNVFANNSVGTSHALYAADLNILSNFGNQRLTGSLKTVGVISRSHNSSDILSVCACGSICNGVSKSKEAVVLCHEVSLAVDFNHDGFATRRSNHNLALSSNSCCLFVGFYKSGLAKIFRCSFNVTISFDKGLLAVHHTCTSAITEFFDEGSGNSHLEACARSSISNKRDRGRNKSCCNWCRKEEKKSR
mmetsp:Transcript_11953/g.16534  ORF Transcript_11953/g.16534 Transcript_11953/m.16534 type:complete len:213 (+) Transcript_11953:387-1025(+)